MIHIKLLDLFDAGLFVIYENFEINISQQIQVNLVTIVSDRHHKSPVLIKEVDLFGKR